MRTWVRALVDTYCGGCPALIRKGDPMQEIQLHGLLTDRDGIPGAHIAVKSRKVRCVTCADGPAPELPAVPVRTVVEPQRKVRSEMAGVGTLARDWKVKQAGE